MSRKNTGSFKSVRIEEDEELASIRPERDEPKKDATKGSSMPHLPSEPIFDMDGDNLTLEERSKSKHTKISPATVRLNEQLNRLKSQVEDISKFSKRQSLTTDQVDVLRNYISLKETEVRDLRDQVHQYDQSLKKANAKLEHLTKKNRDAVSELEIVRRREETVRNENKGLKERQHEEVQLLKNDYEEKLRRSGNYESQMDDLVKKREEWREKIREDLKRIKLKERELENKYELLKRDTQALLDSKDKHVLELKKKNDALELELEGLEERMRSGQTMLGNIDSKKRRLIETLKLAISLLQEIDNSSSKEDLDSKDKGRKAG